jgi:hypothetical protein
MPIYKNLKIILGIYYENDVGIASTVGVDSSRARSHSVLESVVEMLLESLVPY